MKSRFLGVALFAIALSPWAGAAQGAPMIFFGEDAGQGDNTRLAARPNADAARNAFLSNLSGVATEDFESATAGTFPSMLNFTGSMGNIVATLTDGGAGTHVDNIPVGTDGDGRYPISGSQFLNDVSESFTIEFDTPVAAFGFYATDLLDMALGAVTLTLSNGSSQDVDVITRTIDFATSGVVTYFGVIDLDNPFTRIDFTILTSNIFEPELFGFDDMTVGDPQQVVLPPPPPPAPEPGPTVPEPSSIAVWCVLGLFGAAFASRRRKTRTVLA